MQRLLQTTVIVAFVVMLSACVGASAKRHVIEADPSTRTIRPSPGMALVYFIRNAKHSAEIPAALFDNSRYIGTVIQEYDPRLGAKRPVYFAYEAKPGRHMFMVQHNNADFLPAELQAGKTYYVQVRAVFGGRFYFTPQDGSLPQAELEAEIAVGGALRPSDAGFQWAKDNNQQIQKTKAEWWQKWWARPANERLELRPEHGR